MTYFNRYATIISDQNMVTPPYIKLDTKETDDFIQFRLNKTRLDKVSQEKYGSPYFGWLILLANPEYGGSESNIIDGDFIRVPLPLDETLREYKAKLRNRLNYYGQ